MNPDERPSPEPEPDFDPGATGLHVPTDHDRTLSITPRPGFGSGFAPADEGGPARPWSGWGAGLGTFARTLVNLGLIAEDVLHRQIDRMPAPPADARTLATDLVRAGLLTRYQAGAVLGGKTKGLALGNYVVLDRLGSGGGGVVFKARHRKLDRVLALKILPPSVTRDPAAVLRFGREVRLAAQLAHPNVVATLDADEVGGLHFLVMEFVEGRDLASLVRATGPVSTNRAGDYLLQAARGLRAAHERGIVHRDIKPSNLMVDAAGTVKVLDMGLARITAVADAEAGPNGFPVGPGSSGFAPAIEDPGLTQHGAIVGTVDYMAPEQAADSSRADERADLYGLGGTLHFLLTGRAPFDSGDFLARVKAHRETPPPPLPHGVPAPLVDLYRRLMAKDPADRPASAAEVVAALEAFRDRKLVPPVPATPSPAPAAVPEPPPVVPPVAKSSRTKRLVASGLALVAGLIAATAVLAPSFRGGRINSVEANRPTPPPPPPPVREITPTPPAPPIVATIPTPVSPVVAPTPIPPVEPRIVGEAGELKATGSGPFDAVAISGDGAWALAGRADGSLQLWDLATRSSLFVGPPGAKIEAVAFMVDRRRAVSAGDDGSVRLWDLGSHKLVRTLTGHAGRVLALVASREGPRPFALSGGTDGTIRLWELDAPREAHRFEIGSPVLALAIRPGEEQAVAILADGTLRVFDLRSRAELPDRRVELGIHPRSLALTPDGLRAIVGGRDGALVVRDLEVTGSSVSPLGAPLTTWPNALAGLPGPRLLIAGLDGSVLIRDPRSPDQPDRPVAPSGPPRRALAVSPDGLRALTGDADGRVRVWNLPTD